MHETIICGKLVEEAKKYGKVLGVTIEAGELGPLSADEIEHSLSHLVDWDLDVTETPAEVRCGCGYEGRPRIVERGHDFVVFCCPVCKELSPSVVSGDQIILREVKVDD